MITQSHLESVLTQLRDPALETMPRYRRVYRAIRQLILNGSMRAGMRLPSTRNLAISLGLSRDTVENAYAQLEAEGFVDRREGSGTYVSTRVKPILQSLPTHKISKTLGSRDLSVRGKAVVRGAGLRDETIPRAFLPGIPETRAFPLEVWAQLQRQVLKDYGLTVLNHGDPQGHLSLRQAIADYLNLERGAQASPDQVVILTSSQQALNLIVTMLLDRGDRIFSEDPMYYGARRAFLAAGLVSVPVHVDEQGLDVDQLVRQSKTEKAVYVTPSHQYPTGVTLSLERRIALIEWAREQNSWIIEDDYDSEFHYEGHPTACLQGMDPYGRTIYVGTFSKSVFPSLRLGFMVLPHALVDPIVSSRTLQDGHTAALTQLTLAGFINAGHFGNHINAMRRMYSVRRDALVSSLIQNIAEIVDPMKPDGGMQLACRLIAPWKEDETIRKAADVGIELRGLSRLYHGKTRQPGWLLGFAALRPDEIDAGVHKLKSVLTD